MRKCAVCAFRVEHGLGVDFLGKHWFDGVLAFWHQS